MKKKVLFLCTHNSARSQMAEALLNALFPDKYLAFSAGTQPAGINPFAISAMSEIGIDISGHRSKHLSEFIGTEIDLVLTLCDQAQQSCPFFAGAKEYEHRGFPDPAAVEGSAEERLNAFRRVRDEIRAWILEKFK